MQVSSRSMTTSSTASSVRSCDIRQVKGPRPSCRRYVALHDGRSRRGASTRATVNLLTPPKRRSIVPSPPFNGKKNTSGNSWEVHALVESQGADGAGEVEGGDALACDSVASALAAVSAGRPVAILDAADREGETDLFVPAISMTATDLRLQRTAAGGELYIAVGHEVASAFGFPFAGDALAVASSTYPVLSGMAKYNGDMCQGSCSVGLSLDHRSTHTGAPDNERSLTCRRLAEMARDALASSPTDVERNGAAFGEEFHVPGHVFMCTEANDGLAARQGHTELAVALGRAAGVVPVMVGCVMLCNEGDDYGALPPAAARAWCVNNGVPFLDGKALITELAPREV